MLGHLHHIELFTTVFADHQILKVVDPDLVPTIAVGTATSRTERHARQVAFGK